MKVCIYCRVSTGDQDTTNQLRVLTDWADQRGFEVVKVYEEEESAWKGGHQRELARLLDDARKRRFDIVLVWALDRLSREGPLAILTLVNRLKICGVKVISYQESWTEAPGELGELLYAISGWVARMESPSAAAKGRRQALPVWWPRASVWAGHRDPKIRKSEGGGDVIPFNKPC